MTARGVDALPRVIDNWHAAGREAALTDVLELAGVMLLEDRSGGEIAHAVISYCTGAILLRGCDSPPQAPAP